MKYDVCFYRRANKESEQLGQVKGFLRKNMSSRMQVRIRPLHCTGELRCKYCKYSVTFMTICKLFLIAQLNMF